MGQLMGRALAAFGLGAVAMGCAHAQTVETNAPMQVARAAPITITATRAKKSVNEVPATVSVIDAQTIEENLATGLKDLVRFEPGVSVRRSPSRFTAAGASTGRDGESGINIRGLEGNRVLMQVDGVRVPDGFSFGPQAAGRGDYLDLDVVKSVEILRGPSSALYGSDGVAGAVSFLTKDPDDVLDGRNGLAGNLRGSYASADDGLAESVLIAAGNTGLQGLLAYTRRDSHELETKGSNGAPDITRTKANPQDVYSNSLLAKLVPLWGDGQRLRATFEHYNSRADTHVLSAVAVPPLGATSVLDLKARDTVKRDRFGLDYRWETKGFIDHGFAALYHQIGKTRQFSAEDRNTAADRTRDSTFDNAVWGAALELGSTGNWGALKHHWIYGGDWSKTRQEGIRTGTVPPVGETFPTRAFPNTDYILAGLFLQDEMTFGESGFQLYPAIRWDHYELTPKPDALYTIVTAGQSDSHISPKLGAVWQITAGFQVFGNYAKGFKAPTPSQVNNGFTNVVVNYTSIPNPNLKPETSETLELGMRAQGEGWFAGVTGFGGSYDNFIDQVLISGAFDPPPAPPSVFQVINLNSVELAGLEARANVDLSDNWTLVAAGSVVRGNIKNGGVTAPLDSIDPWKLVAGLQYRNPRGYGGQLFVTHSSQKPQSRAGGTCAPNCFRPPAFTVFDATAYWDLTPSVTLRAAIFNVTDEKYWWWSDVRGLLASSTIKDAYTQPGRNFSFSLGAKF